MYHVNKRIPTKKKRPLRRLIIGCLVLLVMLGGALLTSKLLQPTTTITQSKAVVTTIATTTPTVHAYDMGTYMVALPTNWKQIAGQTLSYHIDRWQSTTDAPDSQVIEIYQDTIPANFAVNRELAVQANGDQLTTIGDVSDNCANFTKPAAVSGQSGTSAKWQGVNFLCDLGNYQRDVIGTSSAEAVNTVTLQGATAGRHKFFLSYTDHDISPNYSAFLSTINSFRVK